MIDEQQLFSSCIDIHLLVSRLILTLFPRDFINETN